MVKLKLTLITHASFQCARSRRERGCSWIMQPPLCQPQSSFEGCPLPRVSQRERSLSPSDLGPHHLMPGPQSQLPFLSSHLSCYTYRDNTLCGKKSHTKRLRLVSEAFLFFSQWIKSDTRASLSLRALHSAGLLIRRGLSVETAPGGASLRH